MASLLVAPADLVNESDHVHGSGHRVAALPVRVPPACARVDDLFAANPADGLPPFDSCAASTQVARTTAPLVSSMSSAYVNTRVVQPAQVWRRSM